jgi:hypothetical protein
MMNEKNQTTVNDWPQDALRARRLFRLRMLVLAALGVGAVGLVLASPPLPYNPAFHNFADQRTMLGVPHFLNVISNIPFLIVGLLGLGFVLSRRAVRPGGPLLPVERWPYAVFFLGVGLTAFGSSYYHLEPNNERLLWDRLPMTVAFMGVFSAVIMERINRKVGLWLLPLLVAAGLASALYGRWTELQGRGDFRLYWLVQFYPMLILPLLLLIFPQHYTKTSYLYGALGWYILAKVLENPLDGPIFSLGQVVSGHTLKHLAAAMAAYWILEMLWRRQPVPSQESRSGFPA